MHVIFLKHLLHIVHDKYVTYYMLQLLHSLERCTKQIFQGFLQRVLLSSIDHHQVLQNLFLVLDGSL